MARFVLGFGDEARERKKQAEELDDLPHTTQDTSARFPEDVALRAAGFVIVARPKDREAIWSKGGVEFRHGEAMLRIPQKPTPTTP